MTQIGEILFRAINSYTRIIFTVLFVMLLIILGVLCYYWYAKPVLDQNASNQGNISNNGSNQEVEISFFNVDWCPHCVKAKTEWKTFCERRDGNEYNGYIIKCVGGKDGTNCTDSDNQHIVEIIQKFKIEHYPTLKLTMNGSIIDFDGKITDENLETFISKILN